jgi:AraC family transcriptional regulator, transcriptional activator FtrA
MHSSPTHSPRVVSLAYRGWSLFEAGIVNEVFGLARPEFPRALYQYQVAQAEPGQLRTAGGVAIRADGNLKLLRRADVIVIPGWRDHRDEPPSSVLDALRAAHRRGARLLSICTGAFVLAATGLLDGRRATTHWRYADAFRSRFPDVTLLADVLYVDEGDILTSAGSAAGIDACLHVVRSDYGTDIANLIARTMVTPPHRAAGQAQFVPAPVPSRDIHGVSPVMDWARSCKKSCHERADLPAPLYGASRNRSKAMAQTRARRACSTPPGDFDSATKRGRKRDWFFDRRGPSRRIQGHHRSAAVGASQDVQTCGARVDATGFDPRRPLHSSLPGVSLR